MMRFKPGAVVPFGAALAVVAAGVALAAGTAGAARASVHAAAYRLTANLSASQEVPAVQAPAGAQGVFHGVLFRTGIGLTRVASLAGCKVVAPPSRRSGLPTRLNCGAGLVMPVGAAGQWRLVWRLSYMNLSGPPTRVDIHLAPVGHAAPPMFGLCGPCHASSLTGTGVVRGNMIVANSQASGVTSNSSYVNVDTARNPSGEIRGQIVLQAFGFVAGK